MPIAEALPTSPALEQFMPADFNLAASEPAEPNLDLRIVRRRCPEGRAQEIVVCAPDPNRDRLRPLKQDYSVTEGLPRAEGEIANGVSLGVDAEGAAMANGVVSNRVMARVKMKF